MCHYSIDEYSIELPAPLRILVVKNVNNVTHTV